MELTKEEIIEKILSFSFTELKEWIRKRLHGEDDYFPLYLNHEPNFSELPADLFYHIEDDRFRDNFKEILGKLSIELVKLTKKVEIENSKSYIIELLKLCAKIGKFKNADLLLAIAVSGRFKGIQIDKQTDLHSDLLTTLSSFHLSGIHNFWIEQLRDNSNKYYASTAFYALMDNLDRLYDNIDVFIEKFMGGVELEWGIEALIDEYGINEIVVRFEAIKNRLSKEQRKTVDDNFVELGYGKVYNRPTAAGKKAVYKPLTPAVSLVGEKPVVYDFGETLKEKAGEIFKRLGFEVHFDYPVAGHVFDIFIKRKKLFFNEFECYVCRCHEGKKKVDKQDVEHLLPVRDSAQGCGVIIFSEPGFTKDALQLASAYGVLLKTLEDLENEKG